MTAYNNEIDHLEKVLAGHKWLAGTEEATLADIQLGAELEFAGLFGYDFSSHNNVNNLLKQVIFNMKSRF
jgi:glutathione S-transferase